MIEKVEIVKFKRFINNTIELHPNTMTFVIGGNNAGKSSILHALALWEFCKTVLIFEKGVASVRTGYRGAGIGLAFDDFTPLNIPSFKYLWTNLKAGGGYSLSIKCHWHNNAGEAKYLRVALSLVQERLYIKCNDSNLVEGDTIPRVAYLPTFAGIEQKEQWYSPAIRNKFIGQGLAGAVLRNEIIELQDANIELRKKKQGTAKRLSKASLAYIRENDPYDLLQQVIFRIFHGILYPLPFNNAFHTHVGVDFRKGKIVNNRFKPFQKYNKRDIMVEGSGFLQWLSVYTFVLSPSVDVLLLDEPDAHLHTSLQAALITELKYIADKFKKQVIIATHSSEIIKSAPVSELLYVKDVNSVKYLSEDSSKTVVLSGLGCEYFPTLEKIQQYRRILFVENESDAVFLRLMTSNFINWPENLVVWANANHHQERTHVFQYLAKELRDNFKCVSLNDKDTQEYSFTSSDLKQSNYPDYIEPVHNLEMRYRLLRRSEMENYILHPTAIARTIVSAQGGDIAAIEQDVKEFLLGHHSINYVGNFTQSDRMDSIRPLFETPGKDVINDLCNHYDIKKFDIAKNMREEEVFDDIKVLCEELCEMCR